LLIVVLLGLEDHDKEKGEMPIVVVLEFQVLARRWRVVLAFFARTIENLLAEAL
jgi:hypothetical protein